MIWRDCLHNHHALTNQEKKGKWFISLENLWKAVLQFSTAKKDSEGIAVLAEDIRVSFDDLQSALQRRADALQASFKAGQLWEDITGFRMSRTPAPAPKPRKDETEAERNKRLQQEIYDNYKKYLKDIEGKPPTDDGGSKITLDIK